ncbi:MAG: DegT/DnrJ/EryC1/StrS family aminotransferase, partial [Candidatus Latescibacterota bacterium]
YNISIQAIEDAITDRTRAIIPVHNGGFPCDMDRIMEIAQRHDLMVIEDCAHAHGSEYKGRRCGSIGHLSAFSFQQGKVMTSGEGGIVLTSDPELAEKAYSFMHIGRMPGRPFYEFHRLASNLRMTEWQGAVLLCQLERLDEQVRRREENARYLAEGLKEIPGVEPLVDQDMWGEGKFCTRWSFYYWNFRYRQEEFDGIHRDKFIEALKAEGVPVGIGAHGEPIYRNPLFQNMNFGRTGCPIRCPLYKGEMDYRKVYCSEAERIYREEALSIPHAVFLGDREDMDLILDAIRKVRENTDELKG